MFFILKNLSEKIELFTLHSTSRPGMGKGYIQTAAKNEVILTYSPHLCKVYTQENKSSICGVLTQSNAVSTIFFIFLENDRKSME
jgi:hypothetical protein